MRTIPTLVLLFAGMLASVPLFAAPDDEVVEPAAPGVAEQNFAFVDALGSQFNRWLFQSDGGETAARDRIELRYRLQLNELERDCDLTKEQREKLILAGELDTKQFFEQVEAARQKFLAVKADQNVPQLVRSEIVPLQSRLIVGLHGEHSFFAKTVRASLTPEQTAKYRAIVDARNRLQYEACVEITLLGLDDSLGLTGQQHQDLARLLIEEAKPPKFPHPQYRSWLVMSRLAKLPEGTLRPLLDDREWKLLRVRLDQAERVEASLKQQGIVLD